MRVRLPGGGSVPPPTFKNFVTELASTALVCLGVLDSPITKKKTLDLERAEHLVGLLAMLQAKTRGNLEPMEADYLDAVVDDLRAKLELARPAESPPEAAPPADQGWEPEE